MEALALVIGCALLLGHLLDRALLGNPGSGPIERSARALALGLGALGSVSMAVDVCGLGVTRTSVGSTAAALALLLALAVVRGFTPGQERPAVANPRNLNWQGKLAWVVLLLLAAGALLLAVRSGWVRQAFQFDAVSRWMFKAKALASEQTLLGQVSTDPVYGFTHQRYPPLVSHVANLVTLALGRYDDRIASAIFPWYAVALAGVVYGAVARRSGPLTGALGAFWVAHLPIVCFLIAPPPGAGAASAMADIPLSLFVTGAVLAACDAVEGRRDRAHLEAGLMLGFALLTKNEAVPLLVGLSLALLVSAPTSRLRRVAGVAGTALLVFLPLWGLLALGLPATDENYPAQLTLEALQSGLSRLGLVFSRLAFQLVDLRIWNVTWLAVIALLAVGGGLWRRRALRLVMIVLAVQLGAYIYAYLISAWSSPAADMIAEAMQRDDVLQTLLKLTLDRLLMHVAPLAIAAGLIASPLTLRRSG